MSLQTFLDAMIALVMGALIGVLAGHLLANAGVPLILSIPAGIVAGFLGLLGTAAGIAVLNHRYDTRHDRKLRRLSPDRDETP